MFITIHLGGGFAPPTSVRPAPVRSVRPWGGGVPSPRPPNPRIARLLQNPVKNGRGGTIYQQEAKASSIHVFCLLRFAYVLKPR